MRIRRADAWPLIALVYTAVAVAWTWPLARHLGTRPRLGDLGDPVFNCWVLAWTAGQVLAALGGDLGALAQYWHGNIFPPEPLTLTYSEHLTPQMLQSAADAGGHRQHRHSRTTCCFISTFVLSGLAMYLLVRDLTDGRRRRSWPASRSRTRRTGSAQFSHLQVLSAVTGCRSRLFGLRRYFARAGDAGRATAGGRGRGARAPEPVVRLLHAVLRAVRRAYAGYEMVQRRLVRRLAGLAALAIAAMAVAPLHLAVRLAVLPVRRNGDVGVRSLDEISCSRPIRLRVRHDRPELAALGRAPERVSAAAKAKAFRVSRSSRSPASASRCGARARRSQGAVARRSREWQVLAIATSGVLLAGSVAVLALVLRARPPDLVDLRQPTRFAQNAISPLTIARLVVRGHRVGHGDRPAARGAPSRAGVRVLRRAPWRSPRSSRSARGCSRSDAISAPDRTAGCSLVPGFDGVRVPARFFMLVALFLAVLAGLGAAALLGRRRLALDRGSCDRRGGAGILAEAGSRRCRSNQPARSHSTASRAPPRDLRPARGRARSIATITRHARSRSCSIEFPFGEPAYEILADVLRRLSSAAARQRLLRVFPESYLRRATFLQRIPVRSRRRRRARVRSRRHARARPRSRVPRRPRPRRSPTGSWRSARACHRYGRTTVQMRTCSLQPRRARV